MKILNAIAVVLALGVGFICARHIADSYVKPEEGVIQQYEDLKNSTDESPLLAVGAFLAQRLAALPALEAKTDFNAVLFNYMANLWTAHKLAEQVLEINESSRLLDFKNHLSELLGKVIQAYPLAHVYNQLIENDFKKHGQLGFFSGFKIWESKDEKLFNKYQDFNARLKSPEFWTLVTQALAAKKTEHAPAEADNIATPLSVEKLAESLHQLHAASLAAGEDDDGELAGIEELAQQLQEALEQGIVELE